MKHILAAQQFTPTQLKQIFNKADEFRAKLATNEGRRELLDLHKGSVAATLFYEPSTRTRLSFESAAQRLGMGLISTENAGEFSSAAKGENIEDTIRTINGYAEVIVLRHPEKGTADRAASASDVPIINGGDGSGEHPTQALLDMYTFQKAKGHIKKPKVAFVGDQLHNRTQRSFIVLLAMFDVELFLVSPPELQLAQEHQDLLKKQGIVFHKLTKWDDVLGELDALYINRIEKERFVSTKEYEAVKNSYCVTLETTKQMKKDAIIMAPLPRLSEIAYEVDNDPRAIYFEQAKNGLYVRMALIDQLLQSTA